MISEQKQKEGKPIDWLTSLTSSMLTNGHGHGVMKNEYLIPLYYLFPPIMLLLYHNRVVPECECVSRDLPCSCTSQRAHKHKSACEMGRSYSLVQDGTGMFERATKGTAVSFRLQTTNHVVFC